MTTISRTLQFWVPLVALFCESVGCSTSPVVSKVIFEDQDRMIRLDVTYRTGSQEHSHPATLTSRELATVLQDIEATPQYNLLAGRLRGNTNDSPKAFSEEQIQFLAPLLTQGLNRATPLEEVVFYLNQARDSNIREITSGSLYLQGQELHLILANYRHATSGQREAEKAKTNPLLLLGESWYHVSPGPHSRVENERPWVSVFAPSPHHLIIDYQTLMISGSRTKEEKGTQPLLDDSYDKAIDEKLRMLRELKDEGLLTEKEYHEKRLQVLERD